LKFPKFLKFPNIPRMNFHATDPALIQRANDLGIKSADKYSNKKLVRAIERREQSQKNPTKSDRSHASFKTQGNTKLRMKRVSVTYEPLGASKSILGIRKNSFLSKLNPVNLIPGRLKSADTLWDEMYMQHLSSTGERDEQMNEIEYQNLVKMCERQGVDPHLIDSGLSYDYNKAYLDLKSQEDIRWERQRQYEQFIDSLPESEQKHYPVRVSTFNRNLNEYGDGRLKRFRPKQKVSRQSRHEPQRTTQQPKVKPQTKPKVKPQPRVKQAKQKSRTRTKKQPSSKDWISMREARRIHANRSTRSISQDESVNARVVLNRPTKSWARNPHRSDVKNIDTKGGWIRKSRKN